MNKRFLIAWGVVFVVWMAGSFVVHGLLLNASYAELPNLFRTEEATAAYFHLMLIAHVVMAGAFVWIYQRGVEDKPWLTQGIRFGIAVALLATIPTYTIYFVVQPMPAAMALQQAIYDSVLVIILGIVVAALSKPSTAED